MGVPYAEVIGDPVAHSKSPLIHKFWLEKLGLEGDYHGSRVEAGKLAPFLAERRDDPDWRGCNVTMPLKGEALKQATAVDENAGKAQAANVLISGPVGLSAYNTDVTAVAALLGSAPLADYPGHIATYVQILGAGGAARAAVIGAVAAGYVDFEFFNRTPEKAVDMARWLSLHPVYGSTLDALGPIRNPEEGPHEQGVSHILINATSLGMAGYPQLTVDLSLYHSDTIVLDMAYGGGETALMRQARSLGLRAFDGLHMLVEQAAASFELFFGAPAPRTHDAELRERLTR